jgi:hypothetical protein
MSAFKAPRGVALVACLAMGLLLLTASAALASSQGDIHQVKYVDAASGLALSADGDTALIGGPNGAAWVLTRSGGKWPQMVEPTFTFRGDNPNSLALSAVALSSDGNTAAIGGTEYGLAVFARSGSTWTLQFARRARNNFAFGTSAAFSGHGNTLLVGDPWGAGEENNEVGGPGGAWVFKRKGSTWTQQQGFITSTEPSGFFFGVTVALSADGNTALIGGPQDNESEAGAIGAAWVFKRTGSTWTQQGSKLTGGEEVGYGKFGSSVALSSDGKTALIGGICDGSMPYRYECRGAAWVFKRQGSIWTQQGPKLTGAGEINLGINQGGQFGQSVALSADGNTALVGGPYDNGETGAAWVFKRRGSAWTQQGEKLTCSVGTILTHAGEAETCRRSGVYVALSSDASTAFISELAFPTF